MEGGTVVNSTVGDSSTSSTSAGAGTTMNGTIVLEIVSLQDSAITLFKSVVRSVKERAKVAEAISAYLDDAAVLEDQFGKNLAKVSCHLL